MKMEELLPLKGLVHPNRNYHKILPLLPLPLIITKYSLLSKALFTTTANEDIVLWKILRNYPRLIFKVNEYTGTFKFFHHFYKGKQLL